MRPLDNLAGVPLQKAPFGARQVVLGQPRDLVEERGPCCVVEVRRRQLFLPGEEKAVANVLAHAPTLRVRNAASPIDCMPASHRSHVASRAQRKPLKIWRRIG